jgi:hypothetical protein
LLIIDIVVGLTIELMVDGQTVTYAQYAEIPITDVGNGTARALLCKTDRTDCCGTGLGETRAGEWFYPDGTKVRTSGSGDDFYRNRGTSVVRLSRRNNATQPTGFYCCEVGTVVDSNSTICINLSKCVTCVMFQSAFANPMHLSSQNVFIPCNLSHAFCMGKVGSSSGTHPCHL